MHASFPEHWALLCPFDESWNVAQVAREWISFQSNFPYWGNPVKILEHFALNASQPVMTQVQYLKAADYKFCVNE